MTASLVQRIRGGDIAAFEQLFRELHAPLAEVVDSYVRSQSVAEEIVQDLFFVVWMKRERLSNDGLRGYPVLRGTEPRVASPAARVRGAAVVALGRRAAGRRRGGPATAANRRGI
ncbi:MAG: hypothetical protein ACREPM_19815 [Gemmatimonadaceae bacterium]